VILHRDLLAVLTFFLSVG